MGRKRKRSLSALMVVLMTIGIAGCGEVANSASSESMRPTETSVRESSMESEVKESSNVIEESSMEENSAPYESVQEITSNESETQDDSEISGLIIMTTSRNPQSGTCEVSSFDPDNGDRKVISIFSFQNNTDFSYFWGVSDLSGYYQFDSTYTKMATQRFLNATSEMHAGWLTADGEFFDVTEALGWERRGDFDDPVKFSSIGFTDSDFFVFAATDSDNPLNTTYYSVSASDVSADTVRECCVGAYSGLAVTDYNGYQDMFQKFGTPSSWIDDTHCVLTLRENNSSVASVIFNITDQTLTEYIPGDSRYNWDGHISPDGTQIAFVSVPKKGNESPDVFIVPVSGGEPVRVVEHDFTLTGPKSDFRSGMVSHANCNLLIDWQ